MTEIAIIDHIIDYAAYIAVIAYGISGAIIGIQKSFDILGIFLIAIINAMSGGIIRDALVSEIPVLLREPIYLALIIFSVSIILIFKLYKFNYTIDSKIYIICDALGLSSFNANSGLECNRS